MAVNVTILPNQVTCARCKTRACMTAAVKSCPYGDTCTLLGFVSSIPGKADAVVALPSNILRLVALDNLIYINEEEQ